MNDRSEVARFVDSPDLLFELCRDVIAGLDEQRQRSELDECEKQLKEVARAIDQLEKLAIVVPDELRRLKTDLVAKLAVRDEVSNGLERLADGLKEVLQDLNSRIGRSSRRGPQRRRRSNEPRTPNKVLREEIIRDHFKPGAKQHAECYPLFVSWKDTIGRKRFSSHCLAPVLSPGAANVLLPESSASAAF